MGWRSPRVRGREYDEYINDVVQTCARLFPDALLHFEGAQSSVTMRS